jgi:CBS domain-containing protein
LLPEKVLQTCEFDLHVFYNDEAESFERCSFNIAAANHVEKLTERSNLIKVQDLTVEQEQPEEVIPPFQTISGQPETAKKYQLELKGGSDGAQSSLSAGDFMGEDHGPGKRTGIQAFIDNDEVSLMAIPGVTDPNVQLALVAHCENLGSRFAVLDIPREKTKVADVMTHRVPVLSPDSPVREAVDVMVRERVRAIPVVGEKHEVLGIVSEGDVMRALLPQIPRTADPDAPPDPGALKVRDIMTRSVLCISGEMGLDEAAHMMMNKDVEQLPVVSEGRLTGFLTRGEIIRKLFAR